MLRSTDPVPPARRAFLEPARLPASDRGRRRAYHGSHRPLRLCGWGDSGTWEMSSMTWLSSSRSARHKRSTLGEEVQPRERVPLDTDSGFLRLAWPAAEIIQTGQGDNG